MKQIKQKKNQLRNGRNMSHHRAFMIATGVQHSSPALTSILSIQEIVFVFWLAMEYIFRVWSAGCRSRYRGISGRLRFATSAYCIIG